MTEHTLLPEPMAAKARTVAETILSRLSDFDTVSAAAVHARNLMGQSVWEPVASLYSGAAGSAVAFANAASALPDSADRWRAQARSWLRLAADSTQETPITSACMGAGTAGFALAVAECSADGGPYAATLERLHIRLAEQVGQMSRTADGDALAFSGYDVIKGPAGVLAHLGEHLGDPAARRAADAVIDRLVALCASRNGDMWSAWRIPRENYPRREEEHKLYPHGYVDLGLAHGTPGPLAALSRAWLAGHRRAGMREAIRTLATQLVESARHDDWGITWPRVMPFDAAGAIAPDSGHLGGSAWCYGPPGICCALLDASDALYDPELRALALDGAAAAFQRFRALPLPASPGLCHGIAGLLLICRTFATRTDCAAARSAVVTMTGELLARCDLQLPLVVQDFKPPGAGAAGSPLADRDRPVGIDHPGFLEGAAGVALTLLAVATPAPARWARALLAG